MCASCTAAREVDHVRAARHLRVCVLWCATVQVPGADVTFVQQCTRHVPFVPYLFCVMASCHAGRVLECPGRPRAGGVWIHRGECGSWSGPVSFPGPPAGYFLSCLRSRPAPGLSRTRASPVLRAVRSERAVEGTLWGRGAVALAMRRALGRSGCGVLSGTGRGLSGGLRSKARRLTVRSSVRAQERVSVASHALGHSGRT